MLSNFAELHFIFLENILGGNMEIKNLRRLRLLHFLISILLIIFAVRLYQFQIVDKAIVKKQSDDSLSRTIHIPATRGEIRDRNGVILAYSLETYDVYIDKSKLVSLDTAIQEIAKAYPLASKTDITTEFQNSKDDMVLVIKSVSIDYLKSLRAISDEAVSVKTKMTRVYPNGSLASHVLGITDVDGKGIEGLEATAQEWLAGKDGEIETRTDELGRKLAFAESVEVKPVEGYTIYTTIDRTIQYYAEQAIKTGYAFNEAKRVTAIVQDAKTGEILAMANAPDFDPNNPKAFLYESQAEAYETAATEVDKLNVYYNMWRNPAVSDLYEPGSTFKIFTGLVGLEEAVVSRNSKFYCYGFDEVSGKKVRCWVYPKSHEDESFEEGFQDSCNVVFMEVMKKLNRKAYYDYLKSFGLIDKSTIELGGAKPITRAEKDASVLDLANMSFGHAISITPLHVMNILETVSNDGKLIQPSIINRVETESGEVIAQGNRQVVGQVVSVDTAKEMREILTTVITKGSGRKAYIPGYTIGGKTGTAIKSGAGGYKDERKVYSSFAAIVPSDKPVFNVLVIVDEPKNEVFGSLVAAPIAREIIYNTLQYLEVPSEAVTGQAVVVIPKLVGGTVANAISAAKNLGLTIQDIDTETGIPEDMNAVITKQYPLPGALSSRDNVVFIATKVK